MRLAAALGLGLILVASGCASADQSRHPLTYVALGASDAVGVGATNPDSGGWVPRFGARLGSNVRVVNLGVSGSTLAQALQEQLQPAIDARPNVITVWLAVNDFNARIPLEDYSKNLDTLLSQLDPLHAQVLVGNVPDLGRVAAYRGADATALDAEVGRWNEAIARIVAQHGATLVDLFARWQEVTQHPEYLSQDGFHPSDEGYARLADVFAEAASARPSS